LYMCRLYQVLICASQAQRELTNGRVRLEPLAMQQATIPLPTAVHVSVASTVALWVRLSQLDRVTQATTADVTLRPLHPINSQTPMSVLKVCSLLLVPHRSLVNVLLCMKGPRHL